MLQPDNDIKPHAMSKSELAEKYGISVSTLTAWIHRAKIDIPTWVKILTPNQVKKVFEKIGEP